MRASDKEARRIDRALDRAEAKTNADWMSALNSRKLAELEFHDHDREIIGFPVVESGEPANHCFVIPDISVTKQLYKIVGHFFDIF